MGLATNTVPTQIDSGTPAGSGTTRPNPVALEALVTVTGARPSSEGARDLFTEEARTILVFVDGAVIQLTSPVNEGQLLFLTNKKSNEEVVCQVLQKKKLGATACYVELQFTEGKPNYWGVEFPKEKKPEFRAAEQATGRETGTRTPVHNEKDVKELATQVEVLRKQLAELEEKNAAERVTEEAKAGAETVKQELGSGHEGTGEEKTNETLLMPAAGPENKPGPGWTVPMALPTQAKEEAKEVGMEALPKPELDFSRVPSAASAEEIAARASLKGGGSWRAKLRMAGLAAVLVAVGFGAYEKLAPYVLPITKKAANGSGAAKTAAAKPAVAPKTVANESAPTATAGSVVSNVGPPRGNAPKASPAATAAGKDEPARDAGAEAETKDSVPLAAPRKEAVAKIPTVARERAVPKKSNTREAETAPAEVVAADAQVIPAKLLHAATPVYPPSAMRGYITGDVKAELVVEASGKVGEVKITSGPKALRDAAVEALKKYEYAPATQGGKSVASKTTAVVKFWFNP